MAYSESKTTFLFGKAHNLYVAPLLDHLPMEDSSEPLSFLIIRQNAQACAYAWRNYLNYMQIKHLYKVSIKTLPQKPSHKGIEISLINKKKLSQGPEYPIRGRIETVPKEEKPLRVRSLQPEDSEAFWTNAIEEVLKSSNPEQPSNQNESRSPCELDVKK